MKEKIKNKKIQAASAITIVVLVLYILSAVPVIIAQDPVEDPQYTGKVKVTLNATDDMSGVAHTYYAVDPSAVPITYTEYTAPFAVEGVGHHTIYYYSVDNAGNEEAVKTMEFDIVNPDITPPETKIKLEGNQV